MLLDMEEECSKPLGKLTLHQPSPPCEFFLFINTFPMNLQMRCVDLPWITFQAYHCNECEMSSRLCALSPLQNFKMKKREREIFENNMVIPHW